jgi:Flp pilus assembly protein TadB
MIQLVGLTVALALLAQPSRSRLRRLRAADSVATTSQARGDRPTGTWIENPMIRSVVCGCAGASVGAAVRGLVGVLIGLVAGAVISWQVGRLEPPGARRRREAVERELPPALDLLAACVVAGRPIEDALRAVAQAVGPPLSNVLAALVARLALGGDPIAEWHRLRDHEQLGALARTLLRSLESGAPMADGLLLLAADTRRARSTALQQRARSVGVRAAAPLALCFLPAFMLVGVVPTVVGGFERLVL